MHAERVVRGCSVCNETRSGTLSLAGGETICRPCASRVGSFLQTAPESFLQELWSGAPPLDEDHNDVAGEEAPFAQLTPASDIQPHCDLAIAYAETGLDADAIREGAVALGENVPRHVAQRFFAWLFDPPRARPGALRAVAHRAFSRTPD